MKTAPIDRSEPGLVLIDAIYDHIKRVDGAVWAVQRVIGNLDAVGMERPADDLTHAIKGLKASAQAIADAHSGKQSADMRHSDALTGNLLMLALNTVPRHLTEQKPRRSRTKSEA